MKTLKIAALTALIGITACDGIVGADDDNFTFSSVLSTYTEGMTSEAEAFGGTRTLQVDGIFVVPNPCHELKGSLSRNGAQVEVTVTANPTNTSCTANISAIQYRLQSFGVPRGPLRVTIYHKIGTAPRTLVNQVDVAIG